MSAFKKSYWNGRGRYQDLAHKLSQLIPPQGICPSDSPRLDRYRRARNCYYDLFNNGLCNRASEFRKIFGFSPKKQYARKDSFIKGIDFENENMNALLNEKIDYFILEAYIEQIHARKIIL